MEKVWGEAGQATWGEFFFPNCVARVPVWLWGSGGWGCVRSTLQLCSQPFATVRNRSREDRMAVPMVSSAEVVIFGSFKHLVASFRVAGVALRVIETCFVTRRQPFCVAGAILLRRFQKMCCNFRGKRSTLEVILRGRRSTLDMSCCVFFCKSHWQGCLKWRQGANSVAGAAFCEMGWKLTEASHETSIFRYQNFRFLRKLVGKRRFWCYKVSKVANVSHEMLALVLPRVSFGVSGFPVASPCLWGKLQNLSFWHVANCETCRKSRTKC